MHIYICSFVYCRLRILRDKLLLYIVLVFLNRRLYFQYTGLPGVLFVLPDSYVDAENKDYGGKLIAYVLCIPSFC
jgi:hypothetical protein